VIAAHSRNLWGQK